MFKSYVLYRGQKVEVEIESTFNDGKMANVVAVQGYPFYSADVQSQGKTSGAWMCNGLRVRADFIIREYVPQIVNGCSSAAWWNSIQPLAW